jgi:hypothetical protein
MYYRLFPQLPDNSGDGQAEFHQSFSHFTDITQPKLGRGYVGEM